MNLAAADAGFGVYVHWPFCTSKCPYCDFNSHVAADVDHPRWRRALIAELEAARALTIPRAAQTIFFGGGTPSLMAAETVSAIIDAVDRLWGLEPGAEITIEANPTSVEAGKFAAYAAVGVNRVSLGVQALNDADLKVLGRLHTAAEARAAFDIARAAFARVSFDLIYARQGQSPKAWTAELREAIAMAVDHLSLYQLTVEPGTRFSDLYARGALRDLPGDGRAAALYAATQDATAAVDLPAYEISNHARPGAESRHNLIYWRGGAYVGVGPGAHGRVETHEGRIATETARDPGDWLTAAEAHTGIRATPLSTREIADEYALMALRLSEGLDEARYARLAGAPPPAGTVAELIAEGYLTRQAGRLAATAAGRPILNAVVRAFLA